MITFIAVIILSLIGVAETAYLISKRIALQQPLCPIGGKCEVVLTSQYNKIFFIHNDILGLLTYAAITIIAGLITLNFGPILLLNLLLKITAAAASIFSIYLTYLQWRVLKAWCFLCVMSALTIWAITIILFI